MTQGIHLYCYLQRPETLASAANRFGSGYAYSLARWRKFHGFEGNILTVLKDAIE